MHRRRFAALVLASAALAGCAADEVAETSRERPRAAAAAETLYDRYRRVTGIVCTPGRRHDALTAGSSPLCAPFDSIPAVSRPSFTDVRRARLPASEPVVALELGGEARAYPVRYLLFHEIVNDTVAGEPVVVSFCPLCNSAAAHSRRVGMRVLTFGVSGQLSSANLIMFDRQTLSMWQQMTGSAIAGEMEGRRLKPLPVTLVSFAVWRVAHPGGDVMAPPNPASLPYGRDPYAGYDVGPSEQSPVLEAEGTRSDPRLPPKWRVVGVATRGGAVAFPTPRRRSRTAVVHAELGSLPLVAFFRFGTAEPERSDRLARAPRGWAAAVWIARADGRRLVFVPAGEAFLERTSGSVFDFFGRAVSGPLAGRRLRSVPQQTSFWFAWSHFHPQTLIAPR